MKSTGESAVLRGVQPPALAYMISMAMRRIRKPFVLIASTDKEAEKFAEMIALFSGWGLSGGRTADQPAPLPNRRRPAGEPLDRRIWLLPSRAGHKARALGKAETTAKRIETLHALRTASSPLVVVTSAPALIERLIPPEILVANTYYRLAGETLDTEELVRKLCERGFFRVSLVEDYGDLSLRGGVLDVYAPLYRRPLRFEFFGDQLESIRLFHPSTQRSLGFLEDALILPANEIILDAEAKLRAQDAVYQDVKKGLLSPSAGNIWLERISEGYHLGAFESVFSVFFGKTSSLWEYLESDAIVVWADAVNVRQEMKGQWAKILRDFDEGASGSEWRRPPEELYDEPGKAFEAAGRFQQVLANPISDQVGAARVFDLGTSPHTELAAAVKAHENRERLLEPLASRFRNWIRRGRFGLPRLFPERSR